MSDRTKAKSKSKKTEPAAKEAPAGSASNDPFATAPETMNKAARIEPIDYDALSTERLEAMAAAAEEVINCHRVLAKTGDNIVGELLRDIETFYEWDHYPEGDIYDTETHSQFYYHAHPEDERPGEHGHFHTFLRPAGMPEGITPAKVPDYEPKEDPDDELSHLIAISMDKFGVPIRLFTVNRWVSADVWYDAEDVITFLDYFEMDLAQPSWPLNRWITGMLQLYHPQIAALIRARDAKVAEWQAAHSDKNVFTDHNLETTSLTAIAIDDHVQKITAALEKRR
ncbi:MAG: hypothetical protein P8Z76_10295 [Alphaproteobacteria bacterium]